MRRALAASVLTLVATLAAPAAFGASGSLTDPDDPDDLADVLKLSYANKDAKAVMKMTYDGFRPQNENFYVKWGSAGKYYNLQQSPNGTTLWYFNGTESSEKRCAGDRVRYDAETFVATATLPRSCMPQAPGKVRFRGVATAGLFLSDQTATSPGIRKG